MQLGE